jgi:hypothetical protein
MLNLGSMMTRGVGRQSVKGRWWVGDGGGGGGGGEVLQTR